MSDQLAEETQIRGRTARQGNKGSYSLVLKGSEIKDKCGLNFDPRLTYPQINEARNAAFIRRYTETTSYVKDIDQDHQQSEQFKEALYSNNLPAIKEFILSRNASYCVDEAPELSRTLVLMDATGSMSDSLDKAKRTVKTVFERTHQILAKQGVQGAFEVQFAVYRNYSSQSIALQNSSWEADPAALRPFMDSMSCSGGQGNEAIELGLWHANQEIVKNKCNQVILIGDMPPNTRAEVAYKRDAAGASSYWSSTSFGKEPTYYEDELRKIAAAEVPVHAFYVNRYAQSAFEGIARATGANAGFLDIETTEGANMLTALISLRILNSVGGDARGKQLQSEYVKNFGGGGFVV